MRHAVRRRPVFASALTGVAVFFVRADVLVLRAGSLAAFLGVARLADFVARAVAFCALAGELLLAERLTFGSAAGSAS